MSQQFKRVTSHPLRETRRRVAAERALRWSETPLSAPLVTCGHRTRLSIDEHHRRCGLNIGSWVSA